MKSLVVLFSHQHNTTEKIATVFTKRARSPHPNLFFSVLTYQKPKDDCLLLTRAPNTGIGMALSIAL